MNHHNAINISGRQDTPVLITFSHGIYSAIASKTFRAGAFIYALQGKIRDTPTRYSVQIGRRHHIDADETGDLDQMLDRYPYRFTNHSCEPNMLLKDGAFFAKNHIHLGDELTFNYNLSEYDMAEPFECECGSRFCENFIRGFKHLPITEKERLAPLVPDYLCALDDLIKPKTGKFVIAG